MFVVGLAGKIGSGKTEVSKYLSRKYKAKEMKFSSILSDILDRLHLEKSRENLQSLGESLRKYLGANVIVNAFEKDILMLSKNSIVVIDGIRYENEVEMLRRFPKNLLIFIDAPPKIRYHRCKKRAEKVDEKEMSFEDFLKIEERETEKHLDKIKNMADIIIDNSGSLEELYRKVDEIMEKYYSKDKE